MPEGVAFFFTKVKFFVMRPPTNPPFSFSFFNAIYPLLRLKISIFRFRSLLAQSLRSSSESLARIVLQQTLSQKVFPPLDAF